MPITYKEMVAAARAKINVLTPAEAAAGPGVILDVREPAEVQAGRVGGDFIHIPRGLLEPKADADSGMGDQALLAAKSGPVLVLCAAGGRAALAAAAPVAFRPLLWPPPTSRAPAAAEADPGRRPPRPLSRG